MKTVVRARDSATLLQVSLYNISTPNTQCKHEHKLIVGSYYISEAQTFLVNPYLLRAQGSVTLLSGSVWGDPTVAAQLEVCELHVQ